LKRQVGACIPAAAYTKPLLQIKHTNAKSCQAYLQQLNAHLKPRNSTATGTKILRAVQCRALEYAARMLRCRHHETVVWRRVPTRYRVAGGCRARARPGPACRCVDDCGRVTPAIRLCLRCCPRLVVRAFVPRARPCTAASTAQRVRATERRKGRAAGGGGGTGPGPRRQPRLRQSPDRPAAGSLPPG